MRAKILVVDDEPDVKKMILSRFRKRIADNELSFYFAGNGVEALKVLQEETSIGVILTDINMPVMDGLTLLSKLLELGRPYKAVIVSAYEDMGNIRTAMNLGASDFISKPIDFKDFEKILDKMVEEYLTLLYYQAETAINRLAFVSFSLIVVHDKPFATCVIFPKAPMLQVLKKEHNKEKLSAEEILSLAAMKKDLERAIKELNEKFDKEAHIHDYRFILDNVEPGHISPTMKIRRNYLLDKYQKEISEMYPARVTHQH